MESEDAFSLFRDVVGAEQLLAGYTAWGGQLIARLVEALARGPRAVQPGGASLEEDSVISILIGTHAPSDTVIVTLRLELSSPSGEASLPGFVYVLADPKSFGAALAEAVA